MRQLLGVALLVSIRVSAQSPEDAMDLLRKARSNAESTRTWRAEFIVRGQISGGGMNLQEEVQTKIAVQAPLKLSSQNSGDDRGIWVCDGVDAFYSGDGHSYYRSDAKVSGCSFPLSKFYKEFYKLEDDPETASVVGHDHVRLADGDRECVLVRAEWKSGTGNAVRTMCIDPTSALILRDALEGENEKTGVRTVTITEFTSFESNPTFAPDTFKFSVPPGAVEASPPQ